MKRIYLILLVAMATLIAHAAAPNNSGTYYQNANGKKGAELKTTLCGIIYEHTQRTYDNLWTDFRTTDKRSDGKVWDMYSNITNFTFGTDQAGTYQKEGDVYNREHSFPKSWFGGEVYPMYTDLFHLYPTDGYVNNERGNLPFGETLNPSYSSANGFSKKGPCSYSGYTGTVFEPNDEYKGDFARTYFYMVTCYENEIVSWYNAGAAGVQQTLDGKKYPGLKEWQLNMLLEWAATDKVSQKEIDRNDAVYGIQRNRNPFIDYPGLEQYIWGSKVNDTFSYDNYVSPYTPVTTTYTVAFSDGGSVTEASAGAGVTLPSRSDIDDYTFAGWSTTNVPTETTTAPTIIPTGTYHPTSNITLYPVYTKTEGGSGTTNKTASVNISTYATNNSWSNGVQYSSISLDANVTATANGGGNTGKYYSSGNGSWRIYSSEKGYMTISVSNGELTSATITFSNAALSYNEENITSGTAVSLSGTSASFYAGGTTYISAISVSYTTGSAGTTYYWSSPASTVVATTTTTINSTGITNTDVYTSTAAGYLTATVTPEGGSALVNPTITWSSSNTNVATIDASGVVTLVAAGTTTITASYAGVTNQYTASSATYELTVTNSEPVVDYATLPFEWAGGISNELTAQNGVTGNGIGDYAENNAPYRVKFDNTGDYIQIKTDSQPGVVTIGVKMIGGNSTSYITVKGSTDGETFDAGEQLTISGAQNATLSLTSTRTFATNVRYVRLYFTKGSNVGIGPISIAKSASVLATTTTINYTGITNTDVYASTEAGSLSATVTPEGGSAIANPTITWSSSDPGVATIDASGVVTLVAAGTTTITASYAGVTNQYLASSATYELTVTNSEPVVPVTPVTLTNANIVAAGAGSGSYSNYSITDSNGKTWSAYAIKNKHSNATSAYHFLQINKYASNTAYYLQVPEYGTKITSIEMTVSGVSQPMTGGNNTATLFFSASNRTSTTGSGVASGTGASTVTIDCSSLNLNTGYITANGAVRIWDVKVTYEYAPETITFNTSGYATFTSTSAFKFPDATAATAWEITAVSGTSITFSQIQGPVVAGTGVLLKGSASDTVSPVYTDNGTDISSTNKLVGTTIYTPVSDNQYYGLSGNQFVKVNAGTVKPGKALLPASVVNGNGVKSFTFVFNTADGIQTVEKVSAEEAAAIFNLAGQRLSKPQKGVNIINGKKVIIK